MDLRRQLLRLLYIAGIGPITQTVPWQALEDAGPLRALLQGQRY
ncbi:MAG: hypothetical protein ACYC18_09370 [Gammaproteobacteria bacterium]|nr:hypothetical protein [Gammaproteobacteria bacterium]